MARRVRSLYNNIVAPSKLIHGTDFHLFKEGIEPKWEDPKCARGGKWTFTAPKTSNRGTLDSYWLNTVRAQRPPPHPARPTRRRTAPRTRQTPPPRHPPPQRLPTARALPRHARSTRRGSAPAAQP